MQFCNICSCFLSVQSRAWSSVYSFLPYMSNDLLLACQDRETSFFTDLSCQWYCHNHILSQSKLVTILSCHNPILSQSYIVTIIVCQNHILSKSYLVTILYCHNHILSQSYSVTIISCHNHILSQLYLVTSGERSFENGKVNFSQSIVILSQTYVYQITIT